MDVSIPFKRESVSQVNILRTYGHDFSVSIPFKRESVSQVTEMERGGIASQEVVFQFPSNGKAYHKNMNTSPTARLTLYSFNSLQTGKRITRSVDSRDTASKTQAVSIPFKRESVSQELIMPCLVPEIQESFQFPSNGKAYHKYEYH